MTTEAITYICLFVAIAFGIPIYVYQIVKYGTWGYYEARRKWGTPIGNHIEKE